MTAEDVLAQLQPEFDKRAAPYSHKPSALLALLHAVQEAYGYITPEAQAAVARYLNVGDNRVHEAVTFYTMFRRRPCGKYHLQVCRTLSCDLLGAPELLKAVEAKLGLRPGQVTPDGLFSLETVECLGCCEKAPVLQVNQEPYVGPMTPEGMAALVDESLARERGNGRG